MHRVFFSVSAACASSFPNKHLSSTAKINILKVFFLGVCICVYVVYTYEGGMQGQRPKSGFFLDAFPPYLCVSRMCKCMWRRRQFQALPPQTPPPSFFQGECLPGSQGSLTQLDLQGSELCILSVEIIGMHHYYMDAGDPNSGPHACPRNALY